MNKKIVIIGTPRYSINFNDFWMFFSRSKHDVVKIFFPKTSTRLTWFNNLIKKDDARNSIVDEFDRSLVQTYDYNNLSTLINPLKKLDCDYICVGNGNCNASKLLKTHFKDKMLFSEYGWLPWSDHFYITRYGTSIDSEIATYTDEDFKYVKINKDEIESFKNNFLSSQGSADVNMYNFIYVPLQVDKDDFKFNLTEFKNNEEFLHFIDNIVPKNTKILAKHHPLNKHKCSLKGYKNIIDITESNLNKLQLLQKMKAMACINSTSVLEALFFDKPIFVYGKDIYLNKNIINFDVKNKSKFQTLMDANSNIDSRLKFVSMLMSRQVNRKNCISNDLNYINNHYWNQTI